MRLSEGNKKFIIVVLILAIVSLPIFLVILPLKEKIDANTVEIASLEERLVYLKELDSKSRFFREEIEVYKKKMVEVIEKFPEDIQQENTIMFMLETEQKMPILLYQVKFDESESMPIGTVHSDLTVALNTTETIGSSFEGVHTTEHIGYRVPYEYFKTFINYVEQWEDRLTISDLEAKYELDTGEVVGSFIINQYAIKSEGRELEEAKTNVELGTDNVFSANEEEWMELLDEEENASMNQGEIIRDEEVNAEESDEKETNTNDTSSAGSSTATTGYDCYFMLNQPQSEADAMIVGTTDDVAGKYVIKSDKNRSRLARFTFYEEDGKYYVTYKLSYGQKTCEITPDGDIVLNIYSSDRANSSDLVESSVAVINETDKKVKVNVMNDDSEDPRVTFREKSGNVIVTTK